ncbi:MAG: putative ABC transporter permease [bacterium]|jgi:uncharacterized membrane protein
MRTIRFFLYGLAGWAAEIIWTGAGSALRGDARLTGRTYLWMLPIYGCLIFLEPVHDRIRHQPWYVRGTIWLLLIWAGEYLAGWFLAAAVGACPWDYSAARYNIHGLIRLDYGPVWFVAGFLFERLHDRLDRLRLR